MPKRSSTRKTSKQSNGHVTTDQLHESETSTEAPVKHLILRPDIADLIASDKWKELNPRQRLATFLKQLRGEHTQRGYAKVVGQGITGPSIQAYESGDHDPGRIQHKTLERIAELGGLTFEQLSQALHKGGIENGVTTPNALNYIHKLSSIIDLIKIAEAATVRLRLLMEDPPVTAEPSMPSIPKLNQYILDSLEQRRELLSMTEDNFKVYAFAMANQMDLDTEIALLQKGEVPDIVKIGHFANILGVSIDTLLEISTQDFG